MKKRFAIIVAVITLTWGMISGVQAQEIDSVQKVSGIVTDQLGKTLPGVSIQVEETSIGTTSDTNGKYSLDVDVNATLKFSYIGMATQEIAVEGQQIIDVVMKEREEIEPAKRIYLTERQREKAEADNSLAFKMFREVLKPEGTNTFFSPLSLNMALGMLYNGSSGNTRAEMAKVLGLANFSESEINAYYQKISQALLKIDPTTEMGIANSIWYRNTLPVKSHFIETSKQYFGAEVKALDFNSSSAANIINKWCADKTKNRIDNIVDNSMIDDMMVLINALYFKGKWKKEQEFDKEQTKLDDFTKTDNQKKKVNMMEQTTSLPYYADKHLQCIELPYGNQAFSMVVLLPSKNVSINELIEYLGRTNWQYIVDDLEEQEVWLKLPRFKFECELSLNQPVMNVGINRIFSEDSADFANISDAVLYVSKIKQKTFIEVNEEGTEAAAATIIEMGLGATASGGTNEPVRFFVDRPFLFLIREKSTGVILFIGRVDDPCE